MHFFHSLPLPTSRPTNVQRFLPSTYTGWAKMQTHRIGHSNLTTSSQSTSTNEPVFISPFVHIDETAWITSLPPLEEESEDHLEVSLQFADAGNLEGSPEQLWTFFGTFQPEVINQV